MVQAMVSRTPEGELYYGAPLRYGGELNGAGFKRERDGSIYAGEWHAGLRQGCGAMFERSGAVCVSMWENDQSIGPRVLISPVDRRYLLFIGSLQDGEPQEGTTFFSNGRISYGVFTKWNGEKFEGEGALRIRNNVYAGRWENGGTAIGGVMRRADRRVTGNLRDPRPGHIVKIWKEPDAERFFFYGKTSDDEIRNAVGIHFYSNGEVYAGPLRGGLRHGNAVFQAADGTIRIGEWKNGIQQGLGIWMRAQGDEIVCYFGEFLNNCFHGKGIQMCCQGTVWSVLYCGFWENGKRNGIGLSCLDSGEFFHGSFRDGILTGPGKLILEDGTSKVFEQKTAAPAADTKPVLDKKTAPVAKPAPDTKSVPVTKPAPVAKPVPETKSVPVTRPAPVAKPTPDTKSVPVTKPAPVAKPAPDTKSVPVIRPAPDEKPAAQAEDSPGGTSGAAPADILGSSVKEVPVVKTHTRNIEETSDSERIAAKLKTAAEAGQADAQTRLAVCYYWGRGVEQNHETAFTWYRKAAEQNYAPAQKALGDCYYLGHGIKQNYKRAFVWFQKAAEQNYAAAQLALGDCYRDGSGVEQNLEKAAELYRKAAQGGQTQAQERLAALSAPSFRERDWGVRKAILNLKMKRQYDRLILGKNAEKAIKNAMDSYASGLKAEQVIAIEETVKSGLAHRGSKGILFTKDAIYSSYLQNSDCIYYSEIENVDFYMDFVRIRSSRKGTIIFDLGASNADFVAVLRTIIGK